MQPSHEELELARLYLQDLSVQARAELLTQPWPFETAGARMKFLCTEGAAASPWFTPQAPSGSRVIVLSGLPGAGKNTLLAAISLACRASPSTICARR